MEINNAILLVQSTLTSERFEHSIRVADTAKKLAALYNVDSNKAELAAILHDYAKEFPADKLKKFISIGDLPKELLLYHHELWHGPVGAYLLKSEHGITDEDILNAIHFHTSGRVKMSKLELIIYIADYIEPGRKFPGIDEVRTIAQDDLIRAAWIISRNTIQFLLQKNSLVYPDTIHVYNDLARRLFNS